MNAEYDTLESMCELVVDCPHSTPKWTDEGFLVLRNQNIRNGVLDLSSPSFTNQEDYEKRIRRAVPQAGDIVFTREAPMGEVCIIPKGLQCCLGQRQVLLRPKESVNGEYLFWALQSPFVQHQIAWNEGTGSTVSNVRIPVLKALKIPRHGSAEGGVAKVLSDIANKIELNRQTNQTLEHIAQAIFKSWFVDFEPTRAKITAQNMGADTATQELAAQAIICGAITLEQLTDIQQNLNRHLQQAIDEKLNHNTPTPIKAEQLAITAALFPNALVESELGSVPEGWEVKTMEQLSEIIAMGPFGSNIKVDTFVESGIPVISGQHLKGVMLEDSSFNYLTLKHADKLGKANVCRGDVVFTHAGSIGQVAFIPENSRHKRYVLSQRQFYMRPNKNLVSSLYIVNYFKSYLGQYELLANTSQVGVPSISRPVSNLRKIETVVPCKSLMDVFHELAGNIYNKVSSSKKEVLFVQELRDTLIPKLLSGELDVSVLADDSVPASKTKEALDV
ncbi:restriction endonuclease subunit S [Oceanisphaera pacifica]|uniref:Restriction endonuclease subunit S n=1 Tax=Oceanisphaera pacifica TaxID=2818389 RepID=A0ABS3NJI2_9GAMM|nr:restriction endonuclease subunit S [Oceanisphaera pacifica]MBO1520440.1 restriction endonuclease subunit S [Oceanisphaera pacifica]